MTRDEVKQIMAVIITTYPNFKVEDMTMTVETWLHFLEPYEYSAISNALGTYICNSGSPYPPALPQLISMTKPKPAPFELKVMPASEAWSLVRKALQNSSYNSEQEFSKLPAMIQQAVGSANQLQAWALDDDYNEGVTMSIFTKNYNAIIDRKNKYMQLTDAQKAEVDQARLEFMKPQRISMVY